MKVLGIESSCDETGLAIYDTDTDKLLGQTLRSQIAIHQVHGGVVPELASRDHVNCVIPLLDTLLQESGLTLSEIDGIAYTAGPGLMGALLVGASFAKSLAFSLNKPVIGVHHLEAHILASMLDCKTLTWPFLALLVSGGHTQLIFATGLGKYTLLGDTLDDAVGEAFDKTARIMGIPYPGGAALAALADQSEATSLRFPRPMTDRPGLDFSFSGLKTCALSTWNKSTKDDKAKGEIARAFQEAIVDTLLIKCKRAIEQTGCKHLVVAGGVGANQALRTGLQSCLKALGGKAYYPRVEFCTDNGAMIAYTGALYLKAGCMDDDRSIAVKARWPL